MTQLRILHVASGDRWGGAEAQILTLLRQLKSRPNLALRAVLLNDTELAERLREAHIEVTVLDESYLSSWKILLGLRRIVVDWAPHIIHTHRSKENILGSLANRLSKNVPTLRTSHGAPEHSPGLLQMHKRLYSYVDNFCGRKWQNRVIAVSQDLGIKLGRIFPIEKIVVVENGLDIEATRAAVSPVDFRTQTPDAIHIGLVGRLDPVKRVDIFLAMAALLVKMPIASRLNFHIFGEGQLLGMLTSLTEQLGIQQMTKFHGHRHDIVACIAGLDALVICSDHEGLPMTLLESIAVGTPVVAHAVGGITDVLRTCENGILVNKHEPEHYAAAIHELLRLDQTTTKRPSRSNVAALEKYSAASNADHILAVYKSLTSGIHQARP